MSKKHNLPRKDEAKDSILQNPGVDQNTTDGDPTTVEQMLETGISTGDVEPTQVDGVAAAGTDGVLSDDRTSLGAANPTTSDQEMFETAVLNVSQETGVDPKNVEEAAEKAFQNINFDAFDAFAERLQLPVDDIRKAKLAGVEAIVKLLALSKVPGNDVMASNISAHLQSSANAQKISRMLQDSTWTQGREFFEEMLGANATREMGIHPFSPITDRFWRMIDSMPRPWLSKMRRINQIVDYTRQGKDVFGRAIERYEYMKPVGIESVATLALRHIYSLASLPFSLPNIGPESFEATNMREGNFEDFGFVRTYNRDKVANYLAFIRDQVTMLPITDPDFIKGLNVSDAFAEGFAKEFVLPDDANGGAGGSSKISNVSEIKRAIQSFIWRGFNRALINSVVTPSIRSLAIGTNSGLVMLSQLDATGGGMFYAYMQQHARRNAPTTFMTSKINNYVRKHSQWIMDAQTFGEISSSGVRQSAPFVLSIISQATGDSNLLELASIADNQEFAGDHVEFKVLGMKVERSTKIRNIHGQPIYLKDTVSTCDFLSAFRALRASDVAQLCGLYAYLEGTDIMTDLSDSTLSRYLELSGTVSTNTYVTAEIRQHAIWTFIEKETNLRALSALSSQKLASDPLATFYATTGASLQSMSDYATAVLSTCRSALRDTIEAVLSVCKASREFGHLEIWDQIKTWKDGLDVSDCAYDTSVKLDMQLEREFTTATALARVSGDEVSFTNYFFDDKLFSSELRQTREMEEFRDILTKLNACGQIKSYPTFHRRLACDFVHTFDASDLLSLDVSKTFAANRISKPELVKSTDARFAWNSAWQSKPLVNVRFTSAVDSFIHNHSEYHKISKKDRALKTEDDRYALMPTASWAILAEVNPEIEVAFKIPGLSEIEQIPLQFLEHSDFDGSFNAEHLSAVYGFDWADESRVQRLIDPSTFVVIETGNHIGIDRAIGITLPFSVPDFLRKFYKIDYSTVKSPDDDKVEVPTATKPQAPITSRSTAEGPDAESLTGVSSKKEAADGNEIPERRRDNSDSIDSFISSMFKN